MRVPIFLWIAFGFFLPGLYASTPADLDEVLNAIDRLFRAETSECLMEMTIQTPHWERTLRMKAWSEGMDKTFITILEPKKDEGICTLRVDNDMWNYFPKINKVMKVPPSMMMGSWMGSDFTNDDLVKESTLLEDYDAEWVEIDDPDMLEIKLTPKEQTPTVWGAITIEARASDFIPVRERYFDEKGNEVRVLSFKQVETLGGRTIPTVLELVPTDKEDHKTVVRYLEADFNQDLDPDIFSLRNLKKPR